MSNANVESWGIFALENNGFPIVVRFRRDFLQELEKAKFPVLASVTWEYDWVNENGLPDESTCAKQAVLDELLESIDDPESSLPFIVYTGAGKKEWFWYAKDSENWLEKLNETLKEHPRFPIEIIFCDDANFKFYRYYDSETSGTKTFGVEELSA